MLTFPRYESYKDSGLEWVGYIPDHWILIRLKYLAKLKGGAGFPINKQGKDDLAIPFYKVKHLGQSLADGWLNSADDTVSIDTAQELGAYIFRTGTIVFAKIGAALLLSRFRRLPKPSCIDNNMMGIEIFNNDCIPDYLLYFLNQIKVKDYASLGTIPSLNEGQVGSLRITLPPVEEQKRIVAFLDEKTAEIDEAIAKKRRLIELLQEQKAILINTAVTQGLDPHAPMKESGVEWIGRIPAHWEVKRAKFLFHEVDERSETGAEELLSVSHITGVTPRSEKNVNMFMAEDYTGSKLCRKNDLVFNIMWAWMGALGVSNQTGIVSSSYGVYRQQRPGTFNPWYLEQLLRSNKYIAEYNRRSTGLHSSRLRLYPHMFFDMKISIPSREEQDRIESVALEQINLIDRAINAVEIEIEKLGELRAILISEAVTGQIKI